MSTVHVTVKPHSLPVHVTVTPHSLSVHVNSTRYSYNTQLVNACQQYTLPLHHIVCQYMSTVHVNVTPHSLSVHVNSTDYRYTTQLISTCQHVRQLCQQNLIMNPKIFNIKAKIKIYKRPQFTQSNVTNKSFNSAADPNTRLAFLYIAQCTPGI